MTILHYRSEIKEGDDRSPSESVTPEGNQIFSWVEGPIFEECWDCDVVIRADSSLSVIDDEGNLVSTKAFGICPDCRAENARRAAESRAAVAEREAILEKKRAEIFGRAPKQMGLDMGLD